MKMKSIISVFLVTSMLVGTMVGCGSSNPAAPADSSVSASASGTAAVSSADAKVVTLAYYWEGDDQRNSIKKVVDTYNSSQNKIKVELKYIPFADFKKQLSIGVAGGELPDMVMIDNPDMASYSAMGIFAPIEDKLSNWDGLSKYYPGQLSTCKLDGHLYGLPFGSNDLALFYNEDLLNAAGCSVPTTWNELRDVAKKTTAGKVTGLGLSAIQNEEGTFQFLPWLWSTGAKYNEIGTDNGIKSLQFISDLVNDGSMSKEVINWTQGDCNSQFMSGNLAMMINGPWQVPNINSANVNFKWNVALIPKDTVDASVLGGEDMAVIQNDNIDNTLEFVKYLASPEVMKTYMNDFGYIAPRSDVAKDQYINDPIMEVFVNQLDGAQPRGPEARWPEISDAISMAENEVITGVSTPADAAKKAQDTINGVLNGN